MRLSDCQFTYFQKKNPDQSRTMFMHANDIIKYMPVSKDTADVLSPFLDFTNKTTLFQNANPNPNPSLPAKFGGGLNQKQNKVLTSGKTSTKRCVSETKKKFVAAQQGWKCGDCQRQLPAWFEVDHVIALEHGGSNHVDNLVALCRDCNGKKTAMSFL